MITKTERIKQREGDRLYRSLRRYFKKMKFEFHWTNDETSYFDGRDIYVKYDVQTKRHREFTPEEVRGLHIAHGFHEAGHTEYDYLPDYTNWRKELSSSNRDDWELNKKYPPFYVDLFGNMSLDGRMERLVKLKCPGYSHYLDLSNYDWRFGKRLEGVGEKASKDFSHCFSHRVLGMDDVHTWVPEAVDLADSVKEEIDLIRIAPTTAKCLEHVTDLIHKVWPTLWNWLKEDTKEDSEANENLDEKLSPAKGRWSESAEAAEEASQKTNASSDGTGEQPSSNSSEALQSALKRIAKEMENDIKESENESSEFSSETIDINIKDSISDVVNVSFYPDNNLVQYNKTLASVNRFIRPVARELETLLQGTPTQKRRNVRSGQLMPNQVWRALHCDNSNIFESKITGTPADNAFLGFMTDISGSTYFNTVGETRIIDEMRKSLVLMLEAASLANIPSLAYAFTESNYTEIYRLKSNADAYTRFHKGAVGAITPKEGNRDTLALQYLLDRVRQRKEKIRLAIMLSDGIPWFEEGENKGTITKMVKDASKEGIEVLCLFIGNHNERTLKDVREMYPGKVINAKAGVAKELQRQIKRIIRQSRG
ncbi:hypothetical protein [Viridibacillus arvi]|uniref:hypothetical protein n=1 Tax=Viridibacillus arvi TaxID=263475 RepID=UPI0034CF0048